MSAIISGQKLFPLVGENCLSLSQCPFALLWNICRTMPFLKCHIHQIQKFCCTRSDMMFARGSAYKTAWALESLSWSRQGWLPKEGWLDMWDMPDSLGWGPDNLKSISEIKWSKRVIRGCEDWGETVWSNHRDCGSEEYPGPLTCSWPVDSDSVMGVRNWREKVREGPMFKFITVEPLSSAMSLKNVRRFIWQARAVWHQQ